MVPHLPRRSGEQRGWLSSSAVSGCLQVGLRSLQENGIRAVPSTPGRSSHLSLLRTAVSSVRV